jgi:hypothetical protein
MVKIGWGHLKIFLLRTNGPEKLKTWKVPDIVQIKIYCKNHGLWGPHGAIIGKTISPSIYTDKILLKSSS